MLRVADLCTNSPQTAEELESRNKLLRLLDSVIDALVWAISKLGLTTQQQTLRLGHLTMLLSHIRHVRYSQNQSKTVRLQQNPEERMENTLIRQTFNFHKCTETIMFMCSVKLSVHGRPASVHSNKGMDHLSTMKRKNVVLVYDLLLEMLDANTTTSGSQASSSPTSETFPDQHQYPQAPSHLQPGSDQAAADHTAVPPRGPAEAPILDGHLQALTLQSSPHFQSLEMTHMDNNE